MDVEKQAKFKEFLILLLRSGQTKIAVHNKNIRIIQSYFNIKREDTAARYLKEMESLGYLSYDISTNMFKINKKLDPKHSNISNFEN
jgi:hypothetical protein